MSLAPPPLQAWSDMPAVWRRWFQTLFLRVGGSPETTLAPLASPAFTGTPTAPTATVDTNSTRIATTAFVLGQAASASPAMDGSAAAGASTRYARADHVHPSDTSRAPLASPAFTGTPTAPTAAAGDDSTQIATTAFVAAATKRATVDVTSGSPGSVAIVGSANGIAAVSIVTASAWRCVRFEFSAAMPDTDYVVSAIADNSSALASYTSRQLTLLEKTSAHVSVGWMCTGSESFSHIDQWTHRFSVAVHR